MHEEQWEGVHLKTKHAAFFLEEMGRAIRPPERTQWSIAAEASGAIIDTQWQRSFYPYLDAFLVMARSVPEVINACFGADIGSKEMKAWFKALAPGERSRRSKFTDAFDADRKAFMVLPLSAARNVSLHRRGFAPVNVSFKGFFGMTHVGSPVKEVPIAESRPAEIGGDLPWADRK